MSKLFIRSHVMDDFAEEIKSCSDIRFIKPMAHPSQLKSSVSSGPRPIALHAVVEVVSMHSTGQQQ